VAAGVPVVLAVLSTLRFLAAARAPSPDSEEAARGGRRMGIAFGVIFGFESASIALGAVLLARFGLASWIPP
jgi:hypothetical protein